MNKVISIGYLSSLPVAPLLAAAEHKALEALGLKLVPKLEIGWQALGKKLHTGELDGAVVPPVYPFADRAVNEGVKQVSLCLAMGFGGKRVVASADLAKAIARGKCPAAIRFSTSGPLSCDAYYLHQWLQGIGKPEWRVALRPVTVAATQYTDFLHEGMIDVLVSIEPWATWAAKKGYGTIIPCGSGLQTDEVARVLVMRDNWLSLNAQHYPELHRQLLAEARWAADPANAEAVAAILKKDGWDLTLDEIGALLTERSPAGDLCFTTVRPSTQDITLNYTDASRAWYAFNASHPATGHPAQLPDWATEDFKPYSIGPPRA